MNEWAPDKIRSLLLYRTRNEKAKKYVERCVMNAIIYGRIWLIKRIVQIMT